MESLNDFLNKIKRKKLNSNQVEINFAPGDLERERVEIAKQFGVGRPEKLYKINDKWRYIDGSIDLPIEEWYELGKEESPYKNKKE